MTGRRLTSQQERDEEIADAINRTNATLARVESLLVDFNRSVATYITELKAYAAAKRKHWWQR